MFNLNDKKFKGSVIFNNGLGGLVKNVKISVQKRDIASPQTHPDYQLVVEDSNGGKLTHGFFVPRQREGEDPSAFQVRATREVGRIVHIARAVMGNNYDFPNASTAQEAFDTLFGLVAKNCGSGEYNVYVNYGTQGYPKRFLELRYFNFIENSEGGSTLRPRQDDLLERPQADEPSTDSSDDDDILVSDPTAEVDWGKL